MRLLFLIAETFPTYRADVAALFGKYLPRYGVMSDIVAGRALECVGLAEWGGGQALLCNMAGGAASKRIKSFLHGLKHLFTFDAASYEAIQVRDLPVLAIFGLLAARIKGLPFYYWMSYPMPEGQIAYARERGLSEGLMKFLFPWMSGRIGRLLLYHAVLPWADHVFVQSDQMKADMAERGVPREKMTPVPMGVDLDAIRPENILPADDPRLSGRRVLVYLGTLDRARRIETLFPMLALVKRDIPEAMLVLVGDTQDDGHRRWLHEQAREAGVKDDILWTGWVTMHEGWRYVRAAEVGLSPFSRGFLLDSASPTKVPEYLALGVPVVCNDNPDQQAIIEQTGAGLCVPYTAESFASAVVRVLSMGDPARQDMARRGGKFVADFRAYEQLAAGVFQIYRRLGERLHD